MKIQLHSPEETKTFGERLARLLHPGDVITLEGQLGAGKTTFTKGIASGLEVKRYITSPTFTIVKEYRGKMPLYHMDVYRLEDSLEDIGFDEYFHSNGISVVEWAGFIEPYLPENRLDISIHYTEDEDIREIYLNPYGSHFEQVVNELQG
ncbi:tRNA (adenosine(37)-N6)-threonylcarbamoyltransferase complex ATPase subunit type 1 TsaE [Oceanobacillus sp. 1P07AA]|uniref:tRNA (adenosine(37)-N6)-threonylcarbamoyltransferase complex ATPase subunit type 1 TsaE n=1 Tax=Oceanobacillus sp. 1P07AA TaxID=3132293 RepID=UPI0039A45E00